MAFSPTHLFRREFASLNGRQAVHPLVVKRRHTAVGPWRLNALGYSPTNAREMAALAR
jgi:hypothetical protein